MLKAGIIGTGNISAAHVEGYKQLSEVVVTACCDIDGDKAASYAEKHGIPNWYTDYREMLEKEKLDLVSVTTWNSAHKECTIAALRSGANVLCEKPMAMNAEEANEMYEAAKDTGKLLQVGFVRRFGNDADVVNDFAAEGLFGDIYYAKATYLRRCGCPGGWFGDKAYSGGGPLIDLGVHVIDLVRYLAGNPKPVSVFGVTYDNLGYNRADGAEKMWGVKNDPRFKYTVEDFAAAMIKFENGLTLNVEASFNLNCKKDSGEVQLFGTRGGAVLGADLEIYTDIAGRFVNIAPAGKVAFDFRKSFNAEMSEFVSAVKGESVCRATAEDGVMIMKILDGIYRSAETGHEVVL